VEGLEILVVVLMIFVNGVFAGYEIALASVSVSRLQMLACEGRSGATAALQMKEDIEKSLAVVQLGITLVGLIAGATGGASASDSIAPWLQKLGLGPTAASALAIVIVVLPLTALTIVIGELVPKLFALRNKEWVCLTLSPQMRFFALSTWPIVWLLESSASGLMDLGERVWRPQPHADAKTEAAELQELRAIASLARTSRLIGAREENIILGAARLASRQLSEIILPAEHIRMLSINDTLADCLITAHLDLHTRFPVAEQKGDPQSIIGYVTFKDIVAILRVSPHAPTLRAILRQIPSLKASLPLSGAMENLLREHTHIALVRDDSGKVVGMITLEDIVEELIGDIQDEYDQLPIHVMRSGSGWVVGGGVSLTRLRDITGLDLTANSQATNVNGWVVEQLGAKPTGGEEVLRNSLRVLVRKVRRHSVLEASLASEHP
jgi:putative hemolysin